jgi:hypothetical protein
MNEFCSSVLEKARKAHARVLRSIEKGGKTKMAQALGIANSGVTTRMEHMEANITMLYHLGFKVVEEGEITVDQEELNVLRKYYSRVCQSKEALEAIAE